jgi:hypothetical protein
VPELAYALLGRGRCLRMLERSEAEQPLREAQKLFASMGYKPALADTETLPQPDQSLLRVPGRDRRQGVTPHLVLRRADGRRSERHGADRCGRVEPLELAPEPVEIDPGRVVSDVVDGRGRSLDGRRSDHWTVDHVVVRRGKSKLAEDGERRQRNAVQVDRMRPGLEVVRVRAERHVHDCG